jgi:UDP-N-acetylmuramate--alanine ligase
VITNIDADHMETYQHDFTKLKLAFVEFTQRLPFYGVAVLCVDDPNVREIMPSISKPIITYGFHEQAHIRAINPTPVAEQMHFSVIQEGYSPLDIQLNLPGLHNIQNACAAIAIARELEVSDAAIQKALKEFGGVGRRFSRYGELAFNTAEGKTHHYCLVDDYGHHPVEMAATLNAARGAYPNRRLVLVFQPHRYTRTRDLFEDFVKVLSTADAVILTEVYAAGELAIVAADGRALARALRVNGKIEPLFVEQIDDLPTTILHFVQDQDIIITMGAGSIGGIPQKLLQRNLHEH